MKLTINKAFSLIELLISLIIISCIISAFIPVITKKVKTAFVVSKPYDKYEELLLNYGNSSKEGLYDCKKSADEKYTSCTFKVPKGVNSISAILVGGGGGGAGGVNHKTEHVKKEALYEVKFDDNGKLKSKKGGNITIPITKNMTNIVIKYLIGGGGSGGYSIRAIGFSEPDPWFCAKHNGANIPTAIDSRHKYADYYNGFCIAKYNAGDPNGFPIPSGIKMLQVNNGKYETCPSGEKCCWGDGQTQATVINYHDCTREKNIVGDYSGCYRTVCNFDAAREICSQYKDGAAYGGWRLPNDEELHIIEKHFTDLLIPGTKETNFLPCSFTGQSINFSSCWGDASYIWGEYDRTNKIVATQLNRTSFERHSNVSKTRRYSVRCVQSTSIHYSLNGGGAGASGSVIKNIEIPNLVLKENVGGKIVISPADVAQNYYNTSNKVTKSGNNSSIKLYNSSNKLSWGYIAHGGGGGYNGVHDQSYPKQGAGGDIDKKCEFFNGIDWENYTCEPSIEDSYVDIMQGQHIYKMHNWTEMGPYLRYDNNKLLTAKGGKHVDLKINSQNGIKVGNGVDGQDAYVEYPSVSATFNENKPNYTTTGYALIEYDIITRGEGSSGGDGACAGRIENILVKPESELKIQIGKGGAGGNIDTKGQDGTDSFISYLSDFKFNASGGKGGIVGQINLADKIDNCNTSSDKLLLSHKRNIKFRNSGYPSKLVIKKADFEYNEELGKYLSPTFGLSGGLSGFFEEQGFPYTQGGCGGFFIGDCINNTRNGMSAAIYYPTALYSSENYGTLGSGGGAGGWYEDMNNPQIAGVGGKGLDGFVYLYWKK